MKITLKAVSRDEKEILRNLLEKYLYEFSQWENTDVNGLGLYDYPYLDYYWTEDRRWAYFVLVEDKLAGFVMVNYLPEVEDRETDFQISEFFILHKYRRLGVGKQAVFQVLDKHIGRWQLKRHPANLSSVHFWNRVVAEYTKGAYKLVEAYPGTAYEDGTLADVFFFENKEQ